MVRGGYMAARSVPYHRQTDGQMVVINHTMIHMLRGYHAQYPKTWDKSLPCLQFAFNKVVHGSMLKSPFKVYLGYLPQNPFDLKFTMSITP